jgi:hypothetical protein
VARVPEESTAFPYRDASHDLNIVASWLPEDVDEADRHIDWVRGMFHALEPYGRGVYVNSPATTPAREWALPTRTSSGRV